MAEAKAGISASRMPFSRSATSAATASTASTLRAVVERSVRRLCIALKASPDASEATVVRPATARLCHASHELRPSRTTTMVAMAATTDFNSAFADKRLNIRTALQNPVLLFPMSA